MARALHPSLHLFDYLKFEDASPTRHEYVGGRMYAREDSTLRHNRISGNVFRLLSDRFDGTPCQVFMNDVKLHVQAADSVYYPDVLVYCGSSVADGEKMVQEALLIVEVTSDSSAGIDRREKCKRQFVLFPHDATCSCSVAHVQSTIFIDRKHRAALCCTSYALFIGTLGYGHRIWPRQCTDKIRICIPQLHISQLVIHQTILAAFGGTLHAMQQHGAYAPFWRIVIAIGMPLDSTVGVGNVSLAGQIAGAAYFYFGNTVFTGKPVGIQVFQAKLVAYLACNVLVG